MDKVITFPTEANAFISYQEQLAGRGLSSKERELVADWVEIFNGAYADGQHHDQEALNMTLSRVDELLGQQEAGCAVHSFLIAARRCIATAWAQGADCSAPTMN